MSSIKDINLSGISKDVIIRGVITVIAMINVFCGYLGIDLIQVSNADISTILNGVIIVATAAIWFWGWWKNNSLTEKAQQADAFLSSIK